MEPETGGSSAAAAAYREIGEKTARILLAAEEAAREIRDQAVREAAEVLADARGRASEMVLAAQADRRAAEEDLKKLNAARSVLAAQLEEVRRRLEETVTHLRAPIESEAEQSTGRGRRTQPSRRLPPAATAQRTAPPTREATPQTVPVTEIDVEEHPAVARRAEALGDLPWEVARRLKGNLQEDHNDLAERLGAPPGARSLDELIGTDEHAARLAKGVEEGLAEAFAAGRRAAGAQDGGEPRVVADMVVKQAVQPLRRDLARVVDAGLEAHETAAGIGDRIGEVFRVWKGVRAELLGEGLVLSAFHHGLIDVWRATGAGGKRWVLAPEQGCPRDVCRANAAAGEVALDAAFSSGHMAPPAHGGCECTVEGAASTSAAS